MPLWKKPVQETQETEEEALPPLSPPPEVGTSEEVEEAPKAEAPIESKTSSELKAMLVGEKRTQDEEVRRLVNLEVARRRCTLGAKRIILKQDRELRGLLANEKQRIGEYDRLLIEHELVEREAGRSKAPVLRESE